MKSLKSMSEEQFDAISLMVKFSFVRNFYNKIMCAIQPYSFRHFEIRL